MKFFGLSCFLKLSVLTFERVCVCVYICMFSNELYICVFSNELILWSGNFRYFRLIGKLMQSLITTVENLYAAYSCKNYVAT